MLIGTSPFSLFNTQQLSNPTHISQASVRANQYDATALEQFLDEPHSKDTDRLMDVEVANLVGRWNTLRNKSKKLFFQYSGFLHMIYQPTAFSE